MKKIFSIAFATFLFVVMSGVLAGCGEQTVQEEAPTLRESKGEAGKKSGGGKMEATLGVNE